MTENQENPKHFFNFDGKGSELLKIYLANLLLTIITGGVYYFWAKVRTTRYLYRHSQFLNNRFDYHATGKERFFGFLKGMGFLLIFVGLIALIGYVLYQFIGNLEVITSFIPLTFYLLLFIMAPMLMVGRERFRLSRSSWSNVRFRFDGTVKDAYVLFLKGGLMTAVTCGLYYAWFFINIKKFMIENSKIGNQSFKFNADPAQFLYYFLLGYIVLIGFIMGAGLSIGLTAYFIKNEFVIGLLIAAAVIIFLYVTSWWQAMLERFFWAATKFQDITFESHLTTNKIFKVNIYTLFLVVFTLGFGFPWAIAMNARLNLNNLSLNGSPDVQSIIADRDRNASALYDGISEAGDVIDSISDVFGM